jgi:hypothetical protein
VSWLSSLGVSGLRMPEVFDAVRPQNWIEVAIWTGAAVLLVLPGIACVLLGRRIGKIRYVSAERLAQVDERINKLSAALSLLTDTTESAFRDVMGEVEQLSKQKEESPFDRRVSAHQRIGVAASRGRTAREIALSEGVSEGEVRLRLRLAQHLQSVTTAQAVGE